MKKLWQLLILGYMACAVPALVSAQSLGLNFAATDPDAAQSSLNPTEVAGVVSQANWNNLVTLTGSNPAPLVYDNSGAAVTSTATVTWNSNNTWRSTANNQFPAGPNRKLMTGYLDTLETAAGAATVTVSNIDAALRTPTYDVYVYLLGDSAEAFRGGGYTINDGVNTIVKYGSTMANPTMHVEDPGTDLDNTLDGTFLRFSGLTGTSFTLTADASLTMPAGRTDGLRAPINGIQIAAFLTPGDVNRDGLVNIGDFNIIRSNFFKTGQTRGQGDLVGGDGIVDFADYRNWRQFAPPGLAASVSLFGDGSVPEPTSSMLLAIGAAMWAFAIQRNKRSILRLES